MSHLGMGAKDAPGKSLPLLAVGRGLLTEPEPDPRSLFLELGSGHDIRVSFFVALPDPGSGGQAFVKNNVKIST